MYSLKLFLLATISFKIFLIPQKSLFKKVAVVGLLFARLCPTRGQCVYQYLKTRTILGPMESCTSSSCKIPLACSQVNLTPGTPKPE